MGFSIPWLALAVLGLALVYDVWRRSRGPRLKLPPGPPGIPVLGNLTIFSASSKVPHQRLAHLAKIYTPLMFLKLGSAPCIVASTAEVARIVLKDQDHIFASRPPSSAYKILMYGTKGMAFAPAGEHWRLARKIAAMELMTQERVPRVRNAETSALLAALYSLAIGNEGAPVRTRDFFSMFSFNVITQLCFSKRFFTLDGGPLARKSASGKPDTDDEQQAMDSTQLITDFFELLQVQLVGDYIPYLSFLDRHTRNRMTRVSTRFDSFLNDIVTDHKTNPNETNSDFLDVLLKLADQDAATSIDETSCKALCTDILLAATESTANVLEWTIAEIIRYPEVASKLQAEMDSVVGKERSVTDADIPKLPYFQATMKEVLRMHPAGAFLIPHMSTEQTTVMGYDIPANTTLFVNVWAIARDPDAWDEPEQFRPERFLERPDIDVKGQHFQLLPFGAGRRRCPGTLVGLNQVHHVAARLIQAFEWSPPPGVKPLDVDVEEISGLSLVRANPLHAVPTPRLPYQLYHTPVLKNAEAVTLLCASWA